MKKIISMFFLIFILLTACSESDNLFIPVTNQGELQLGSWVEGSFDASQTNSYYFSTTAGESYAVYWDDSYDGSGSYTADVMVSAFNSDYSTEMFYQEDSGYYQPLLITDASGENYCIRVEGYSTNDFGTYAIKVVQTNILPIVYVTNQVELSLGSWVPGNLAAFQTTSYYFSTTAGESYAVYWDDSYDGSGPYTADVMVSAFNSDYSVTNFYQEDSGYYQPLLIINASEGNYYIRVEGYSPGDGGTYAIKVVQTNIVPIVSYTVSGTITLPSSVTDVTNFVAISTSSDIFDMPQVYGPFVANGSTFSYSLTVASGTYYIFGLCDLNKDDDYWSNSGEYMGYWGGSGINPPGTINLIVDGNKTGIDFNVSLVP